MSFLPQSVAEKKSANTNRFKPVKEVSVMAWIENQFGDVLLLKQSQSNKFWTLPGGKVRPRESLIGALKREVLEETGLKIQAIVFVQLFDRNQKGAITFLFQARIKGRKDAIVPQVSEIGEARFSPALLKPVSPSLRYFWKKMQDRESVFSLK